MITLSSCATTEEALEAEQEIPTNKNVTLNQEIDGGETSVTANEENKGKKEHSPLIGKSEETCYVDADATKSELDPTLLSNISVSLISEFLKEVEPLPPAGIPMDACVYQIGSVKAKGTTFVTFKGKNLNSFGNSKLSGPDGFQESVLKALYRALKDKRKLICDAYGEYIEKCGGTVKKIPADKMVKIQEIRNEYDQLGKRIAVLDSRIEKLNITVVADSPILHKWTLFFHYLNYQWGWSINSNGDKFEGEYFGRIVGLKPHGKGIITYPNGFKSGDEIVELFGEWKEGEPWNVNRYNKAGEKTGMWVNGVMIDKTSLVMEKSQQGILYQKVQKYEGEVIEWVKDGNETKDWKYVGEIRNDMPNGQGKLTGPTVMEVYEGVGEFKDGKFHGHVTINVAVTYLRVSGEYTDGKKTGLGTEKKSTYKIFFDGKHKDGHLNHGHMKVTYSDGRKYEGEWKDGRPWNVTYYDKNGNIKSKIVNGNKIKQ